MKLIIFIACSRVSVVGEVVEGRRGREVKGCMAM